MRLPREHGRPIAVGLLLLALALAYVVGLHWWWTAPMLTMGDHIEDLRQQELQSRMTIAQKPAIEKKLTEVRKLEAANPGFLSEASVELAQASLTQRIESQIAAVSPDHSACTIVQRTPTPWAGSPERYQRVVVQVRLLCGMKEFSALLHAFESGRPELFVDNLNVISQHTFVADNDATDNSQPLNISFDLYGYLRSGSGHAP
ncbi:MAG TPA: type II secretion system protein GspM [Xanthomonadaceae bacterium]|jgi:general secretion pathway protein M|nr:type II secretion system protein GspM [Xanthomonadaceae bacterium]